mmetsp:Transcript_6879/g.14326  ORF Transcript_6879/g.14326 Transcript_6879/m.14326 type:complete len:221 (+) Transcript_6879:148-810(+)|eukprot:CAMPEP_0194318324 /NCGR_PEP_ID=MMETSP0171-20130528/14952_1 /TAXON_ID=218684 /ORGANISM="Corethron pennatum, Strain L29A3" /LENGTH=220 /DNA_ID=CAMNT_0039075201 /DNA_START=41 /DNA_END=703 /DNA_ORIENTATION=+
MAPWFKRKKQISDSESISSHEAVVCAELETRDDRPDSDDHFRVHNCVVGSESYGRRVYGNLQPTTTPRDMNSSFGCFGAAQRKLMLAQQQTTQWAPKDRDTTQLAQLYKDTPTAVSNNRISVVIGSENKTYVFQVSPEDSDSGSDQSDESLDNSDYSNRLPSEQFGGAHCAHGYPPSHVRSLYRDEQQLEYNTTSASALNGRSMHRRVSFNPIVQYSIDF